MMTALSSGEKAKDGYVPMGAYVMVESYVRPSHTWWMVPVTKSLEQDESISTLTVGKGIDLLNHESFLVSDTTYES